MEIQSYNTQHSSPKFVSRWKPIVIGIAVTAVSLVTVYHYSGIYRTSLFSPGAGSSDPIQTPVKVVSGGAGGSSIAAKTSSTGALQPAANTSQVQKSTSRAPASTSPTPVSPTPPPPSPVVTPPQPVGACSMKPDNNNTGASGNLPTIADTRIVDDGTVLENVHITGGLEIDANNVTIHNVKIDTGFLIIGDNAMIDHVSASGIGVSSAQNPTIQYSNFGPSDDDALHITSDRGRLIHNVTLKYNYIHDPSGLAYDAHYDGTQVRGVSGMTITCSHYDSGPWQHQFNAAIYFENANGGDDNITVANNWIDGWGYTVSVDSTNTSFINNRFGHGYHWGLCDNSSNDPATGGWRAFTSSGNVWDDTGEPVNLCEQG